MSDEKYLTLKDFLPEWMQAFSHFEAFAFLEKSFHDWTKSKNTEIDRLQLQHAYENFKHLCENDPSSIQEKEKMNENLIKNKRDSELKSLYEKKQKMSQ